MGKVRNERIIRFDHNTFYYSLYSLISYNKKHQNFDPCQLLLKSHIIFNTLIQFLKHQLMVMTVLLCKFVQCLQRKRIQLKIKLRVHFAEILPKKDIALMAQNVNSLMALKSFGVTQMKTLTKLNHAILFGRKIVAPMGFDAIFLIPSLPMRMNTNNPHLFYQVTDK